MITTILLFIAIVVLTIFGIYSAHLLTRCSKTIRTQLETIEILEKEYKELVAWTDYTLTTLKFIASDLGVPVEVTTILAPAALTRIIRGRIHDMNEVLKDKTCV